ncbi:MAG: hypothetical protein NUV69_02855 [Candidatus Curtissbacteria bacterium]|nr:hypothetical protein [Candidatus Curtissbacteria bacterium]
MDITQTILLTVIVVLAVFLAALGFQVFFVLKDMRKTLWRMNRLFDDADDLVSQVKKPIDSAGNFFTALTAGAGIAHILNKPKGKKSPSKKNEQQQQ